MKKQKLLLAFILVYITDFTDAQIINIPADKPTIQAGIDSASFGDTVLVAEGTYLENINFKGKAITVASRFILDGDTSYISKTIIDGSQPVHPDTGSVVLMCSGEDSTSVLCGFTITGGSGIFMFTDNNDKWDDDYGGGGVAIVQCGGKITHNIIEGNKVIKRPGYDWAMGGGIFANARNQSTCIIRDNTIRNNEVRGNWAYGSGVYLYSGRHIVEGNTIVNNLAVGKDVIVGGAFYWGSFADAGTIKEVVIRNNLISENIGQSATNQWGGTMALGFSFGKFLKVHNNIIAYNQMDGRGGGIYAHAALIDLANNTLFENTATIEGNSVLIEENASVAMYNNIIWSDTTGGISDIAIRSGSNPFLRVRHNLLVEPIPGIQFPDAAGNIYAPPAFENGGFGLKATSPGIGWGIDTMHHSTLIFLASEKDFYGNTRPDPVDGRIDIGAIESPFEAHVYIPDTAFLHALIDEGVDTNGDSLISYEEAESVNSLDVGDSWCNRCIKDMTGIEAFVNLDSLTCNGHEILELDLTYNTALKYLNVCGYHEVRHGGGYPSGLELTSLELSECTALEYLNCSVNQLKSLDLSNQAQLKYLGCGGNQLEDLDLSNNTLLEYLKCGVNQMSCLDISKNTSLKSLEIIEDTLLSEVCVWETFNLDSIDIAIEDSPNICFETNCNGVCDENTGKEESLQSEIHIYPNPTYTLLTIETEFSDVYEIEITSLNGQYLFSREMKGNTYQLDLSTFQSGVYFITIRSKDFVTTKKIIKL